MIGHRQTVHHDTYSTNSHQTEQNCSFQIDAYQKCINNNDSEEHCRDTYDTMTQCFKTNNISVDLK